MKTFEERYTAWIDGQLTGSSLTAFEQELERRAAVGEAEAEKEAAGRLRSLMREHLQAPELDNTEFFSHQLRDRIDAECDRARRHREGKQPQRATVPLFVWSLARLVGLGAACLFVAGALYYGVMPPHQAADSGTVAKTSPAPAVQPDAGAGSQIAQNDTPTPAVDPNAPRQFASLTSPTPAQIVDLNSTSDIAIKPSDAAASGARATPLYYKDSNVNVLWVNGLEYSPTVPGTASAPATGTAAAPGTPVNPATPADASATSAQSPAPASASPAPSAEAR